MKVKDQIKQRMADLQISVTQLAARVGVSNQTVRFWLQGRNFPGKRHASALEATLGIRLDYSEAQGLSFNDAEMLVALTKLPADVKDALKILIQRLGSNDK